MDAFIICIHRFSWSQSLLEQPSYTLHYVTAERQRYRRDPGVNHAFGHLSSRSCRAILISAIIGVESSVYPHVCLVGS